MVSIAVASLTMIGGLIVIALSSNPATSDPGYDTLQQSVDLDAGAVETMVTTVSHPNFRYSVIPGGAHKQQELMTAIDRDPVVASHYRNLSPERVRVERLPEMRRAYVSYRVGDRIYWTKHKVTLPAGELTLTDGVTRIRARCGNCISDQPQLPTSDQEPASAEFDALAPAIPAVLLPGQGSPWMATPVARLESWPPNQVSHTGMIQSPLGVPAGSATNGQSATPADGTFVDSAAGRLASRVPTGLVHPVSTNPLVPGPVGLDPGDSGPDYFGLQEPGSSNSIPDVLHLYDPEADAAGPGLPDHGSLGGHDTGTPTVSSFPSPERTEFAIEPWGPNEPIQPAPIPEPSTIILMGTGVAGALWRRVRARRGREDRQS